MMESYLPLITGLIGALIGSGASIIVVIVQARKEDARSRRELAVTLALEDYKAHLAAIKEQGGGDMAPIVVYLAHHIALIDAAYRGSLDAAAFKRIVASDAELRDAVMEFSKRDKK